MAANIVKKVKLGSEGLEVSVQGLGCMGMSAFCGSPETEEAMIELIHYAINSGITFLDTSDVYGPYTNEILLSKVLLPLISSFCRTHSYCLGVKSTAFL